MRVFVAGATGAIGRPLVRQLNADGHEVVGMTRSAEKTALIEADGGQPVIVDALDHDAVVVAIKRARPEVLIDQLTDLPQRIALRGLTKMYRRQSRLRQVGSGALLEGAREARVTGVIAQSIAFLYAPNGGGLKEERDRVWRDAPPPTGKAFSVAADHDETVVESTDFCGIVLRYGVFYGPGTHFAPGNGVFNDARRGRLPLVGRGEGVWSFAHVEDCARATVGALARGRRGIYNIVDDDPAPYHEWVPYWVELVGGKRPPSLPRWLARVAAGPAVTSWATARPGASNAKAKRELGWEPEHPSWREGFLELVGRGAEGRSRGGSRVG
jgi:2-alkyl-3-oxoalkanoate reductase